MKRRLGDGGWRATQRAYGWRAGAALALLLAVVGCGSDDGAEEAGSSTAAARLGSETTANRPMNPPKVVKGTGPAKSPTGKKFFDLCDRHMYGNRECLEFFSDDPKIKFSEVEDNDCDTLDERCPVKDITGTCLTSHKTSDGAAYDVVKTFVTKNAELEKEFCLKENGQWTPGSS